MNQLKKLTGTVFLGTAIAGLSACAQYSPNTGNKADKIVVEQTASGQTVELKVGQEVTFLLKSNPSTGYGWVLTDNKAGILQELGNSYDAQDKSKTGMVGVPGTELWRFKAVKPGKQILRLEYRRAWEKKEIPAVEKAAYKIIVE